MKVCQRCGLQEDETWRLDIETKKSTNNNVDYSQWFTVCGECRDEFFNRVSVFITDAGECKP